MHTRTKKKHTQFFWMAVLQYILVEIKNVKMYIWYVFGHETNSSLLADVENELHYKQKKDPILIVDVVT